MKFPYQVCVAPGCYSSVDAPVVSQHRTLAAAVRAAMKSDRVRVEPAHRSVCLFQASSRQPTKWGCGAYGGRHVGTFAEALAGAQQAEREVA